MDDNSTDDGSTKSMKKTDLHSFQICAQDGTVFQVNPHFLAEFSPFFEALFFGDFEEARQKKAVLQDETANSIETLLGVLGARGVDKGITLENIADLLRMANKYDISEVYKDCREFIRMAVCNKACKANEMLTLLQAVISYPIPNCCELKWDIADNLVTVNDWYLVWNLKLWEKIHDARLLAAIMYTYGSNNSSSSRSKISREDFK